MGESQRFNRRFDPIAHALHAPVPRRAESPASGLGGRGQARQAHALGPRVEGPVAVQQGEDAVLLRQRPEEAWFDFSSGKNGNIFDFVMETEGVDLSRGGRAAGADGRRAAAEGLARGRGARRRSARRCTTSWSSPRNSSRRRSPSRAGAKARGYLADRGLDAGDAAQIPPRLCAGRALRAEGASRRARHPGRGHDRGRAADRRRRHPGAVTTASATA